MHNKKFVSLTYSISLISNEIYFFKAHVINVFIKNYCGVREFMTPVHFMLRPKACVEDR